jgi:hypothetical protein
MSSLLVLKLEQEYQENETGLTVDDCQLNQAVNIFGCKNSTILIKGKVNAITLGESYSQAQDVADRPQSTVSRRLSWSIRWYPQFL